MQHIELLSVSGVPGQHIEDIKKRTARILGFEFLLLDGCTCICIKQRGKLFFSCQKIYGSDADIGKSQSEDWAMIGQVSQTREPAREDLRQTVNCHISSPKL